MGIMQYFTDRGDLYYPGSVGVVETGMVECLLCSVHGVTAPDIPCVDCRPEGGNLDRKEGMYQGGTCHPGNYFCVGIYIIVAGYDFSVF